MRRGECGFGDGGSGSLRRLGRESARAAGLPTRPGSVGRMDTAGPTECIRSCLDYGAAA